MLRKHLGGETPPSESYVKEEMARLDMVVDAFAAQMKIRLIAKVKEGRGGWEDPANAEEIYTALLAHAASTPLARFRELDIANYAMFLWFLRTTDDTPENVSAVAA